MGQGRRLLVSTQSQNPDLPRTECAYLIIHARWEGRPRQSPKGSLALCWASIMVRPLSEHGRPPRVHGPGCDLIKGSWPPFPTVGHYGHRCPLWPPPPIISKSLFFVPSTTSTLAFASTSAKKEANIGNESKQGETSQSNLELWTEFETAFPDPADSKC